MPGTVTPLIYILQHTNIKIITVTKITLKKIIIACIDSFIYLLTRYLIKLHTKRNLSLKFLFEYYNLFI